MQSATTPRPTRARKPLRIFVLALALLLIGTLATTNPATASAVPTDKAQSDSAEHVAEAMERLRVDGMITPSPAQTPDVVLGQASTFGRSLFHGVAFAGGQVIISEVLAAMGYNPDDGFSKALNEINDSIAALNDEVRKISEQVERLLEGQDRTHFYNSYTQAGVAAANLDTAMRSVGSWVEKDLQPSESNLSDMQTVITTSIGQLDFLLTNPTTGTIPLMMKAGEPTAVSDLTQYWIQIETARDDYRAVLAQGLATLSVMERWDTTGTIGADLEAFTPRAKQTVAEMYEYGVGLDATRVQVKGNASMLVALEATPVSGESGAHHVGDRHQVEPLLAELAASYRPSDHGGQTLEAYLVARGVPTRVNYLDTYAAGPRNSRWASFNIVGQISGNNYSAVERQFGQTYSALNPAGHTSAWNQANYQRHIDGPGATRLSASLNVGGRVADFTPEAVVQAAFGLE